MRRTLARIGVVVLLVAPGIGPTHPVFRYAGPDSRLRLQVNGSWVVQLPVPDPYADTIGTHISRMYARTYFSELGHLDLFHGHLMLRAGAPGTYDDVGALLRDTALFVYHTAEFSGRWQREAPKPLWQRNPRSLVGFWDGRIAPAITLVAPGVSMPFYESNGTISDSELRDSRPELFNGLFDPAIVRLGPRAWCAANLQFLILPDPWGRLTVGSQRYDVYIRCEIDRRELGLNGYDVREREYVTDDRPW